MPHLTVPIASGRTAEIYAWEPGTVLKLFRAGFPQDHADYEARVARAVCAAGVPAPGVLDVIDVEGRRGIVYPHISGKSMLQTLSQQPWRVRGLAYMLADLQAAMHRQSASSLPNYRDRLERDIQQAPTLPGGLRGQVLSALASLPGAAQVCHGDFHPDNVLLTRQGPFVIDWMTASQGNPFADVARTQLLLNIGEPPDGTPMRWLLQAARKSFFQAYMARYLAQHPDPEGQIGAWVPIIAAARLNENISAEIPALLAIVQKRFGS